MALKKIESITTRDQLKRILREIKILTRLNHENIVKIEYVQLPIEDMPFNDIQIGYEIMDTDLASMLKHDKLLTYEQTQFISQQLIRAMNYMHKSHLLHRDLKPRNILISKNCEVKIADQGLVRQKHTNQLGLQNPLTDVIATRQQRSPEILLCLQNQDENVDVWAIGCCLAEMYLRRPIFNGMDSQKTLIMILDLIGTPSEADIKSISQQPARNQLRQLSIRPKKDMAHEQPDLPADLIGLLQKIFVFDPKLRITCASMLRHPYISEFHDYSEDHTFEKIDVQEYSFDHANSNQNDILCELLNEIMSKFKQGGQNKQQY